MWWQIYSKHTPEETAQLYQQTIAVNWVINMKLMAASVAAKATIATVVPFTVEVRSSYSTCNMVKYYSSESSQGG